MDVINKQCDGDTEETAATHEELRYESSSPVRHATRLFSQTPMIGDDRSLHFAMVRVKKESSGSCSTRRYCCQAAMLYWTQDELVEAKNVTSSICTLGWVAHIGRLCICSMICVRGGNVLYKRAGHTSERATPPTLHPSYTLINNGSTKSSPKRFL